MDAWTIGLALVAMAMAVYHYIVKDHDYFKKRGIPYIRPMPLVGNSWGPLLRVKSFAETIQEMYNADAKAKYVGGFDLMSPVIVVRDPELIKLIGIKLFDHFPDHRSFVDEKQDPLFGKNLFGLRGDRWRDVRAMISPTFTSSKMRAMYVLMSECAVYFSDFIAKQPVKPEGLDIKDAFTRYTNDVIATCAFGISINSMEDRKNLFYVYGREGTNFGPLQSLKFFAFRFAPWLMKVLKIQFVRQEISSFFTRLVADTIKTRDEKGIVRPDMIQLMMETRGKVDPDRELTIEDMTAQSFAFFFGGFESTSTTLCFAAHEVALNREIQERLQAEIDQVLEDNNGDVTYEAINGMKYLDAVINETLRLYPIAVVADRLCMKAYELPPALPGAKPFLMEPGSYVWFPVYGIQRDGQYFEDPERFNPDRFVEDSKKIINSGAYIPFGLGPRMCIGNRFALLECKALLVQLLARVDLKPCARTPIPMVIDRKGISMTSESGFWLTIQPRSNPHPSVLSAKSKIPSPA